MHDLPLLVTIAVALTYALAGGLVARRIGLPTIVGYLVAGVALGPFAARLHADPDAIRQLAEFGVILLMFGVGLNFSVDDLWRVRDIAIPGALIQLVAIATVGYVLARFWGWPSGSAWLLGFAISIASTVVLLRSLMDRGLLDTLHGHVAIGWSVVEDLATVAVLVLLPSLFGSRASGGWLLVVFAAAKVVAFLALMLFAGRRLLPWMLSRVVRMRSRELFILVALTMAAGIALASAALFGVSLALGAFVAGIVVGESPFSHQVGADLLPFREAFAVIFFVSVGMLVKPSYLWTHWAQLLALTGVIVAGKAVACALIGFAFPYPARTALVVAAGRSQIGEFSFIVGQTGMALGLLDESQYSLVLAGAIVSITINPLMFQAIAPVERMLKRSVKLWQRLNRHGIDLKLTTAGMADHVVIVGCGRVGRHIAEALGRLQIPRLVIEADPARLDKLRELGVPVLYGDAANSELLEHAALRRARALITTLPDDAAAVTVVTTVRRSAPTLHIVARASTWEGARRLSAAGANQIVRPELEGGVEIVRRTLLELNLPARDVQRYTDLIRREGLDESERASAERARVLDDFLQAARETELEWINIADKSPVAGQTLAQSDLRATTGVLVVAIRRDHTLIANPRSDEVLRAGDRVGVIGSAAQVAGARRLFQAADQPGMAVPS